MKIESRKLKNLIPSEYNPRQSTKAQEKALSQSLQKYGCVEPIIVNEHPDRQNIIVGGHFRVRELIKLRVEEVECVIVNLTSEEEKELNIRLNSNTGEWNFDLLLQNFNLDELESWGFNSEQLEDLAFKTEENKVDELIDDTNDLPEIPQEPKTRLGDLFYLGEHRLLCGDSTNPELVKKLMAKEVESGKLKIESQPSVENNLKDKTFNLQLSTIINRLAWLLLTRPTMSPTIKTSSTRKF